MGKQKYLENILREKAINPRYCKEDIKYLNLSLGDKPFKEISVLQKCFCDIPLHRITDSLKCSVNIQKGEEFPNIERYYSHTDLYGEYGIALTKSWGERSGIQPVQYINEESDFCEELSQAINEAISTTVEIDEKIADNYLNMIAFFKPLRGEISRFNNKGEKEIVTKNFHDEHEWRFVPKYDKNSYDTLIANPTLLSGGINSAINKMSDELEKEENQHYWLQLQYNDIRYIIVPNNQARLDCINYVMSLKEENTDKYLLISKILVLEEIRRDW